MNRRGVTLLELLVALTIAAVLTAVAIRTQLFLDRALRSRAERAGAAGTLRAARAAVRSELSAIGLDSIGGPDLRALVPGRVEYRADRGIVAVCRLTADSVVLDLGRLRGWRSRDPVAGRDSLLILVTPDSAGEGWVPAPLLAGPSLVSCPGGGAGSAFRSAVDSTWVGAELPTAARVFETAAIESYGVGGTWQIGLEGISAVATIQPFAGPIDGATGMSLAGWDRLGAGTGTLGSVAGFDLVIRALARREVAVGPGAPAVGVDSVRFAIRAGNVP